MAAYTAIDDAGSFFNPVLYSGTAGTLTVSGVGFQPDCTWLKARSEIADWGCFDSVRGATECLKQNNTNAESTLSDSLTSWNADGFVMGSGSDFNASQTYGSWNWKAGTTTGIAGSPSITPSSYSFNATSGFSIIAYTGNGVSGATIPHGLGAIPDMVMVKSRTSADAWTVFTSALGPTKYLVLNTAAAEATASWAWNDTAPTSTLVSLGSAGEVNGNTIDYVAYCFTSIQGYSKFSSYIGNGNVDGTFVYTGFRPAFVMMKCATRAGTDDWPVFDDKRLGYNVDNNALVVDDTDVTRTQDDIDIVSNGWKCRIGATDINAVGNTMCYMAFAESRFVNSSGVPTNAR